jgi:hypothetical protein
MPKITKGAAPIEFGLDAYSIPEFCRANGFSRGFYYKLKRAGLAPDEAKLLGRVIITKEAAARWRKQRTARRMPAAPASPVPDPA